MAKKIGQVFYIVFCGVPLTALVLYGLYLYYYHDYGPLVSPEFHDRDDNPKVPQGYPANPVVSQPAKTLKLVGKVKLESASFSTEAGAGRQHPITAEFVIANEGSVGAQVLYTPWPSALLDVRLQYLGTDGKAQPERQIPNKSFSVPSYSTSPNVIRPMRHFTTIIPPGDKVAIPVNLVPPFELKPGVYKLEVLYDPLSYCTQARLSIRELNAYAIPLQTPPIQFTVGEVPVAPQAPAEGKSSVSQAP